MIRVAVVDDNQNDAELLCSHLSKFEKEYGCAFAVSTYHDGLEFIEKNNNKHDIVFLDIEMPLINGVEIAKKIRKIGSNCAIIFVTNMSQYALQGYEVEARGYILKPASYYSLATSLKKTLDLLEVRKKSEKGLLVNTQDGAIVINSADITYIESGNHYSIFHTKKGDFRTHRLLKEIEEELSPYNFVRCNNCYLVNLAYVDAMKGNVVNVDGALLSMTRTKKAEFLNRLMSYLR